MNGGRFDFDDGGTYIGGWEEGKAHGHGVCTGPMAKGEFAGAWHYGFEVSGVYTWPSGNTYYGQWQNGKLHGLGVEHRGRGVYRGEWTQGYKGRYGVRQSTVNQSRYQGTWSAGYHDGYGTEIYVDGGHYQGQWLRGTRHGYGTRKSSSYGTAAKFRSRSQTHASMSSLRSGRCEEEMTDDEGKERIMGRGGFVLKANSSAPQRRRRSLSERSLAVKRSILTGLRIKKQHSTGSLRSSGSTMSCTSEDSLHKLQLEQPEEEPIDENVTEIYMGEWKNDARSGFGVCERSDGLKYHGEWANNAKCGYGVTTLKDGTREEGKYKNNVLIISARRRGALFVRATKIRERVEAAYEAAQRAASIAQQKADIAASRTSTAKERAEQAKFVGAQAQVDADIARKNAAKYDPSFLPAVDARKRQLVTSRGGESFGTDLSDPHSFSRHLSETHSSNKGSFEQNLSIDMPEGAYLTPLGPGPSGQMFNHIGQQSGNHVNFHLQPTYHGSPTSTGAYSDDMQGAPTGSNSAIIPPTEEVPPASQLEHVVELAEASTANTSTNLNAPSGSTLLPQLQHNQQSSSRFSLSDDHYDQYVMAGNPGQARIRRNKPLLTRQSDVNDNVSLLNRRSTLASPRDRQTDTSPELNENMGSLPNLAALENTGVRLKREEAARLASQRRQEVLRDQEDQALLRANPLRYLFHPTFRAWLLRYKVPLLLAAANLSLLCLFYNLLTYDKKRNS
ncbi:unnamed protein product [Auanema sp. JU1783]|nr:unnamed protein product [Auanema sp. JU1783]